MCLFFVLTNIEIKKKLTATAFYTVLFSRICIIIIIIIIIFLSVLLLFVPIFFNRNSDAWMHSYMVTKI